MFAGIRVSNIRQATALILEKIYNLALLGKNPDLVDEEGSENWHYMLNSFDLDGKHYRVSPSVFSEVMKTISQKDLIEIKASHEQDVAGYFQDPMLAYEFIADFVREDPEANVRELMKENLVFFEMHNLDALKKEMVRFSEFKSNLSEKEHTLSFDERDSVLSFQGKKITISKNKRSDSHHLLSTLFKEREKIWALDEIQSDWDPELEKEIEWRKIYNACRLVNNKIALVTQVTDFLSCSSTEVFINKRYL